MTLPSGQTITELIAGIELFAGIERPALERLAEHATLVHVPGGDTVMREGEQADALYVVASGRLQAFVGGDGGESLVGEIGRGEVIGEMGVLADEPRSATVRALRDSNLIHIPADQFIRFLRAEPDELFAISQLLIQRLRRSIRAEAGGASVRTITVVPVGAAGHFRKQLR